MTDTTADPLLDLLLSEVYRGHKRVSQDEIQRRAIAADLPAELVCRVTALPEGEYALDEAIEALRLA